MQVAVVLESKTHLYELGSMKLLYTLETGPNPRALCALATSDGATAMAVPQHIAAGPTGAPTGRVLVFDTASQNPIGVVEAHKTEVL